jgi:cell shape-determining protein MreC
VASPELLQTIQHLQAEITELRTQTKQGMTADEKAELTQLKQDLTEARKELNISKYSTLEQSGSSKRIVNYGTFCTVEDVS